MGVAARRSCSPARKATRLSSKHRDLVVKYLAVAINCRSTDLLCALASPQLLMPSGIGPADVLDRNGIAPVLIREEVGRNLHDHIGGVFEVEGRRRPDI